MWSYMFAESYGVLNQFLQWSGITSNTVHWVTGVNEAFISIVIADVWKTTPYMALLLLSGLKTVPSELQEAAQIDGAGQIKVFFKITESGYYLLKIQGDIRWVCLCLKSS